MGSKDLSESLRRDLGLAQILRQEKDGKGESGKNEKQKVPSILKQLLSDDNQLQKKVIDANTVKGKARDKKDW